MRDNRKERRACRNNVSKMSAKKRGKQIHGGNEVRGEGRMKT